MRTRGVVDGQGAICTTWWGLVRTVWLRASAEFMIYQGLANSAFGVAFVRLSCKSQMEKGVVSVSKLWLISDMSHNFTELNLLYANMLLLRSSV
jgi:hypothetical protein